MAPSAFHDLATRPTPAELEAVLGAAVPLWAAIVADVRSQVPDAAEVWRHAGPKFGWSMRLLDRKRVIAYLTPQADAVLVGVVLGEKAIAVAKADGTVSATTDAVLDASPRYTEGRGVRVEVRAEADLAVIRELVAMKLRR